MSSRGRDDSISQSEVVASHALDDGKEVLFSVYSIGERELASVRVFVNLSRYSGPTKNGIDMTAGQLGDLLPLLRGLRKRLENGETVPPVELGRISAGGGSEWVVRVIEPDNNPEIYCLDVRKYVTSESYTGWTKKGLRLAGDRIDDIIPDLEKLLRRLESGQAEKEVREDVGSDERPIDSADGGDSPDVDSVPDRYRHYF